MVTTGRHFDYDEVPYPDLCYVQTHPDRLATLGKLLGMTPAPVEKCRVLELGCASGANLLPMAAILPESTFVGVDYSAVQIERAQVVVNELGFQNIHFWHTDFMDITSELGKFDYIIAHGIYSWIPPEVQDKLLDICKQNLAPQGIAYVSYNTYPGWHTLDIIRNMMLYVTRDADNPEEKSRRAREWVSFMGEALSSSPDSAYSAIFQNYLHFRPTQKPDFDHAALLHDEMEVINSPVYFHQFAEHAEKHGLQYLVEADFPTVMPNDLRSEVVEHLGETARTTIEMEQYLDFLRNRTFRRTLLCHDSVEVNRRLTIDPIAHYYVASFAKPIESDAAVVERSIERFEASDGKVFATDHPVTKAVFHYLSEITPRAVRFGELLREACSRLEQVSPNPADAAALAANLLQAFSASLELVEFHVYTPRMVMVVSDKPLASPMARYQAQHGILAANLLHRRVELDNLTRLILMNLDGQNDRNALLEFLIRLADEGKIGVRDGDEPAQTPEDVRRILAKELDSSLEWLAKSALLIA